MSKTDAIAVFAEGSFEEQVRGGLDVPSSVALSVNSPTDRRARRVHRTEPTGAGTRTICPINPTEAYRRGRPDALNKESRVAERVVFCRI